MGYNSDADIIGPSSFV